jgi:hypothetical protein
MFVFSVAGRDYVPRVPEATRMHDFAVGIPLYCAISCSLYLVEFLFGGVGFRTHCQGSSRSLTGQGVNGA